MILRKESIVVSRCRVYPEGKGRSETRVAERRKTPEISPQPTPHIQHEKKEQVWCGFPNARMRRGSRPYKKNALCQKGGKGVSLSSVSRRAMTEPTSLLFNRGRQVGEMASTSFGQICRLARKMLGGGGWGGESPSCRKKRAAKEGRTPL